MALCAYPPHSGLSRVAPSGSVPASHS